ncbi:hypothetical protein [Tomitella biformata]|uniref:hypothetical protein n=1 Tax=Tomitella biformata TaxID=630403 RepID=UPI0004636940|nr:hypothetical protein [Tomitella biformata]
MDWTSIMSGVGTVVLVGSLVMAILVSLLLFIVSIWPNFLNNWKSPASTGPSVHESAAQAAPTATQDK